MLILRVLLMGPAHGHAIAHAIERASDDLRQLEHGLLYPALHRLETRGWIVSFCSVGADNRRARYYRLTTAGENQHVSLLQVWLGVSIALALSSRPSAQTPSGPLLEVATLDRSSSGAELGIARGRVRHIFADAGIRVLWTTRSGRDSAGTATRRVRLVLLSGSFADEIFLGHGDVLGIAIPAVGRVYVHYDRVVALARRYRTPSGWFLGLVIAHELAHVLLPGAGHAENGLMAATLSPEALPMFTAREAQSLRASVEDGATFAALGLH
jgi:PadR family transcriptional regulator PadR